MVLNGSDMREVNGVACDTVSSGDAEVTGVADGIDRADDTDAADIADDTNAADGADIAEVVLWPPSTNLDRKYGDSAGAVAAFRYGDWK